MFSTIHFSSRNGRKGNIFIRNMIVYLLSRKYDTLCEYQPTGDLPVLGINFINSINKLDDNKIIKVITDEDVERFLYNNCNVELNTLYKLSCFCQKPSIIIKLNEYFQNLENEIPKNIIKNNKYKYRYNNNNDIFIHIRAGDVFQQHPPIYPEIDYYEKVLQFLKNKETGDIYISSDDIKCGFCQNIIKKYNCKIYNKDCNDTILFGSTCKYIIMSAGSYSYMIGLFGFYSELIFYSKDAGKVYYNNDNFRKRYGSIWHPPYYNTFEKNKKYLDSDKIS